MLSKEATEGEAGVPSRWGSLWREWPGSLWMCGTSPALSARLPDTLPVLAAVPSPYFSPNSTPTSANREQLACLDPGQEQGLSLCSFRPVTHRASKPSDLDSRGCHRQVPQSLGLETRQIYSPRVLEARSQKRGYRPGLAPSDGSGEDPSLLCPASGLPATMTVPGLHLGSKGGVCRGPVLGCGESVTTMVFCWDLSPVSGAMVRAAGPSGSESHHTEVAASLETVAQASLAHLLWWGHRGSVTTFPG